MGALSNGILAGLVSISGVADRCEPWSAFLIGIIGSVAYIFSCMAVKKLGVDDPIEACMVHGGCGIWGTIAVGIFDNKLGLISSSPDSFAFFGCQILGMIIILFWTSIITVPYFLLMRRFGLLRVPLYHEIIGLDVAVMGSNAKIEEYISQRIYQAHMQSNKEKRYRQL